MRAEPRGRAFFCQSAGPVLACILTLGVSTIPQPAAAQRRDCQVPVTAGDQVRVTSRAIGWDHVRGIVQACKPDTIVVIANDNRQMTFDPHKVDRLELKTGGHDFAAWGLALGVMTGAGVALALPECGNCRYAPTLPGGHCVCENTVDVPLLAVLTGMCGVGGLWIGRLLHHDEWRVIAFTPIARGGGVGLQLRF